MRGQFSAIVQLAIALAVFLFIEPRIEDATESWGVWGKITSNGLALVASSALIATLSGKIFGPLKIQVDWEKNRVTLRGPCEQLTRQAGSMQPLGAYDIHIACASESLRGLLVAHLCRRFGAAIIIDIGPPQSVLLIEELAHPTATVHRSTVSFDLSQIAPGTVSWVSVSIEPVAGMPKQLRLHSNSFGTVGRLYPWFTPLLFSVECLVREIEVTEEARD